jgi:sugar phosphate isomerase/epimerase
MSEKVEVQRRESYDGLFELAAAFVGGATRLSLALASVPLVLLPRNARRRVRRAMGEVARAIVALPKELADVSVKAVDDFYAGGSDASANARMPEMPSAEELGDRARRFTDRLARAAEEFGAGMRNAANRQAENAEQAAARVDEWVEKA